MRTPRTRRVLTLALAGAACLALTLTAFAAGVQKRGKCQPGDRTILDAVSPAAEAAEKAGLRRQIMDSESDFYTGMLNKMQAQVEKTRDDKEQQAIVDALGEVLDALSGKKDVTGEKASVNKTASDLTAKMGERIARLKQEDPEHPEAVKLEQMLKRLQELGIYFDLSDTDDIFTEEEDSFETLTQLLTRRQREEAISDTPQTERGEQQQ